MVHKLALFLRSNPGEADCVVCIDGALTSFSKLDHHSRHSASVQFHSSPSQETWVKDMHLAERSICQIGEFVTILSLQVPFLQLHDTVARIDALIQAMQVRIVELGSVAWIVTVSKPVGFGDSTDSHLHSDTILD